MKRVGGLRGGPRRLIYRNGVLCVGLIWDEMFSYHSGEIEFLSEFLAILE